jgi:nitronate monooxygenase
MRFRGGSRGSQARRSGADAIIAQGFEAGGHVRGTVTTLALVPEVRDAIGDLPMLAAGGIADGRGLAAVIALGADGAVFGTRFLA